MIHERAWYLLRTYRIQDPKSICLGKHVVAKGCISKHRHTCQRQCVQLVIWEALKVSLSTLKCKVNSWPYRTLMRHIYFPTDVTTWFCLRHLRLRLLRLLDLYLLDYLLQELCVICRCEFRESGHFCGLRSWCTSWHPAPEASRQKSTMHHHTTLYMKLGSRLRWEH